MSLRVVQDVDVIWSTGLIRADTLADVPASLVHEVARGLSCLNSSTVTGREDKEKSGKGVKRKGMGESKQTHLCLFGGRLLLVNCFVFTSGF